HQLVGPEGREGDEAHHDQHALPAAHVDPGDDHQQQDGGDGQQGPVGLDHAHDVRVDEAAAGDADLAFVRLEELEAVLEQGALHGIAFTHAGVKEPHVAVG